MKRAWLLLFLCACSGTPPIESDWEREHAMQLAGEEQVALPPYPKSGNLVPVYVSATSNFKFFVDASTLSVSPRERVIRYVLVARSPSGVDNVSYEAIRCPEEYRVLAVGEGPGKWASRPSPWRPIVKGAALSWPYVLSRNFFCPHRDPILTVAEGQDALRRGSHPAVYVEQNNRGGGD
ncbi:MAG TPA: CNP1-like family protein [Burkholderiales bacterium]|nr:CNP1-like family protein [Burkholderiales bacterium]